MRSGESERETRDRLKADGYTVNRDTKTYRVYVLELEPKPAGKKGWLYVGETEKTVEERIQDHVAMARNSKGPLFSRKVAAHFKRRRKRLEPGAVYMTREASKAAEKALAQRLREDGYEVTSN